MHFSYDSVVAAFAVAGIDASFDETTPDRIFRSKVSAYRRLSQKDRAKVSQALLGKHEADLRQFMTDLSASVLRQIERIVILVLYGASHAVETIDEAIRYIESHKTDGSKAFERIEIQVRYNNGNVITGTFRSKEDTVKFLRDYQPVSPRVA